MQDVINFVWNNGVYVLGILFAVSELLAQIPSIKSNSIFQLLFGWLKTKTGH